MAEILDKNILKALNNETRQEIIKLMTKRPYTASELSKKLNKHITTIIEHLDILQKANLIKRKDSTNKWVYYSLTDKGEKLFKPKYYSWIITLYLSIVVLFAGLYNMFLGSRTLPFLQATEQYLTASKQVPPITDVHLLVGIILIFISIIGFAYAIKNINKNKIKN